MIISIISVLISKKYPKDITNSVCRCNMTFWMFLWAFIWNAYNHLVCMIYLNPLGIAIKFGKRGNKTIVFPKS